MLHGYRQLYNLYKTEDICVYIAKDVEIMSDTLNYELGRPLPRGKNEIRSDTLNYELERPLPRGKNEKVIGLMKDKLGGKIITEVAWLRPKTYSYLIDDMMKIKKIGTKKCVIKQKLKLEDYKKCLEANQLEKEIKHLVNKTWYR